MLNAETINQLKKKLEDERTQVGLEIKELEKMPDFGSDTDHFEEETDQTEEYGANLSMSEALKERLREIEDALDKIANGKYGICEKCGSEIDIELLNVDPESRLCRNCKKAELSNSL